MYALSHEKCINIYDSAHYKQDIFMMNKQPLADVHLGCFYLPKLWFLIVNVNCICMYYNVYYIPLLLD